VKLLTLRAEYFRLIVQLIRRRVSDTVELVAASMTPGLARRAEPAAARSPNFPVSLKQLFDSACSEPALR